MRFNKSAKVVLLALVTGIGASLCCIAPVLALIGGVTGIGSTFSFMEPFRPYLTGLTLLLLGLAWYQYWRNQKKAKEGSSQCACEDQESQSGFRFSSFPFLFIITLLALGALSFPWVIGKIGSSSATAQTLAQTVPTATYQFKIKGMTCTGCEAHIQNAVGKLKGVVSVKASYKKREAIVTMDTTKVKPNQVIEAIESAGYTPLSYQRIFPKAKIQ